MRIPTRLAVLATMLVGLLTTTGCTTTSLVLGAAGVATDTNISWAIAKHLHEKLTDGDPLPCFKLDSVQRALSPRCGAFEPGSLRREDVARLGSQDCALGYAAQDPRLWPVLPELIDKGAQPETCRQSPLARLAQRDACPDFASASPEVVRAMTWLAEADARAIQHDVMRMLSCPSARQAGLSGVLDRWLAAGALEPTTLGFSALGALHPDYLLSPFAYRLELGGHTAAAAFASFEGRQPAGFETALRASHWAAIDWWLQRRPDLVNRVPALQGDQLPWLPLARVLVPSFLDHPDQQRATIEFLLARGADPQRRLPYNAGQSVAVYAKVLKSPYTALLERPPEPAMAPAVLASGDSRERGQGALMQKTSAR